MRSRAIALLLMAVALSSSACASLWGFETITAGGDASLEPETRGDSGDAGGTTDAAGDNNVCSTMCSGQCVDTMTSHANCGGCGNACPTGGFCQNGTCSCPGSETRCSTECIDLANDSSNCGGCSRASPPGSFCQNGNFTCLGTGATPCGGFCVNSYYDPTNCGTCGSYCGAGVGCQTRGCGCTGSTAMCDVNNTMTCVDTNSDPSNCGSCGKQCPPGADCKSGVCACAAVGSDSVALCSKPDASPPTSACADLTLDSDNCGSCAFQCSGGAHCQGGTCVCLSSLSSCGGACVDEMKDNDNCGGCGKACPASATCDDGGCR